MKWLLIALLATTSAALAEMRTWTFEKGGKTIEAELVGFAGDNATMKLPDGKAYTVPVAYLIEKDRLYLAEQKVKQWKDVEVVKLKGATSAGRYKRCVVHGVGLEGSILIQLLPASVEEVLNKSNQQTSEIKDLSGWIDNRGADLRRAEAQAVDANRSTGTTNYYVKATSKEEVTDARENLPKLQKAHADYVAQTKGVRTVKIKNTGLVYEGLPVWECADPRKSGQ